MRFKLNEQGNDYVVGDIHGCFSKLQQALDEMGFNPEVDRLFCVGDLVDRGPESEACIDWLCKTWFYSIRGNHEQMAIDAVKGYYDSYTYHRNGGAWYLGLTKDKRGEYASYFEGLPLWMEIETKDGLVGLVHGDGPSDWANIEKTPETTLLWGRDRFYAQDKRPVANITKVYCGHTPLKEKTILGNTHYIDTGAVFNGKFTIEKL